MGRKHVWRSCVLQRCGDGSAECRGKGGGELFGMKKLTTIHSWKILIRAFAVPDPTLHFPACNLLAFTVGFRSV